MLINNNKDHRHHHNYIISNTQTQDQTPTICIHKPTLARKGQTKHFQGPVHQPVSSCRRCSFFEFYQWWTPSLIIPYPQKTGSMINNKMMGKRLDGVKLGPWPASIKHSNQIEGILWSFGCDLAGPKSVSRLEADESPFLKWMAHISKYRERQSKSSCESVWYIHSRLPSYFAGQSPF